MRLLRRLPLLCLLPVLCQADEPVRKWTDAGGRSFEGSYVSATDAKVTIKRADGKVFDVERSRLSKEDQDYLTSAAKAAPAAPAAASLPKFDPRDYRAHMLEGYDGSAPNFKAPWPKDGGVDKEPEITTVEENTGEKRFIYESPHFRFESNVVLRPSLLAKVAMMFEACYQMHHDIPLNNRRTRSPKAPKLNAFLFETMEEYHTAGGPQGSSGVYMSKGDKFLVPLEGLGVKKVGSGYMFDYSGNFHTVYHEVTHQLWADLGDYAGIWMIEGFAEFMASAPYSNGKFSFIKQPSYALEYATGFGKKESGGRDLGKEFTMPHLKEIMTWSQPQFYANGNKNYGLGMLLVYYFVLLDGDGTGARFKDCIQACQEGKSEADALQVLLGDRSYEALEKDVSTAFKKKGIKISFQ